MSDKRLAGKVALVTGAAGGIGTATARVLAHEGARLALVDLDEGSVAALASELGDSAQADGAGKVLAIGADVADSASVQGYVARVADELGGLDVLFNNAGIEGAVAPIHEQEEELFDRVLRTNVRGVWLNLKHAAAKMIELGGGSIINTSSGGGLKGLPQMGPYVASKHAVIGLTRTAAIDLAKHGIRVNAICPGPVDTRMIASLESQEAERGTSMEDAHARRLLRIPFGRYAQPEEIAAVVAFLASDAASYMSGAVVPIDGGMT